MLSMDKEAIKELTEMEAVPICNILGSLLGRSVKMSVSKVEETDMGSLAEGLPHFNVAIESRKAVGGMSADQLYIFAKEDMIRLTNYIMGVPVDAQSPLDEIALSTLKEVASQCVGAAMDELNDFLGRDMRDTITRISAFDNTERIQDIIRSWNAEDSVLLMGLHYVIDGGGVRCIYCCLPGTKTGAGYFGYGGHVLSGDRRADPGDAGSGDAGGRTQGGHCRPGGVLSGI